MNDSAGYDFDKERSARAAEHEGAGIEFPIRLGGKVICVLPPELPLAVFAPVRTLDQDITMMLRSVVTAAKSKDAAAREQSTDMVIDLLAANPALPVSALNVVGEVAKNLCGEEGYAALLDARLSKEDVVGLAKAVMAFYGVTLGEASAPSGSPEGSGPTSSGTSSVTSGSTPEVSGPAPEPQGSLVSAAS